MSCCFDDADLCPLDALGDSDHDGSCDSDDLCPTHDDRLDGDFDGVPDDCDPCKLDNPDDSDGDGVCDSDDQCDGGDDRFDLDEDGIADACDDCPLDNPSDSDADGTSRSATFTQRVTAMASWICSWRIDCPTGST